MAHFYGTLQGDRAMVTRCGHRHPVCGLRTVAASWQGSVKVELYESDGVDFARISLEPWKRRGNYVDLYDGPVSGAGLRVSSKPDAA